MVVNPKVPFTIETWIPRSIEQPIEDRIKQADKQFKRVWMLMQSSKIKGAPARN